MNVMRKVFSLILAALFIATLPLVVSASQPEATAAVTCVASPGTEQGNYDINIVAEGLDGVAMVQFTLAYDPESVKCIGAEAGEILGDSDAPTINDATPGKVVFVWESLKPISQDGVLLTLHFEKLREEPAEIRFFYEDPFLFVNEEYSIQVVDSFGCELENITGNDLGAAEAESEQGLTPQDGRQRIVVYSMVVAAAVLAIVGFLVCRKKYKCTERTEDQ